MDPYISVIIVVLLALVIGIFVWFVVLGFQVRSQAFSGTFTPVSPNTVGSGTLSGTLTPGKFVYNIRVSLPSSETVTQAGIYQNGALLLSIRGPTSPPYEWVGEWALSPAQAQDLLNGNLYALVSTSRYPNGALRAPILRS